MAPKANIQTPTKRKSQAQAVRGARVEKRKAQSGPASLSSESTQEKPFRFLDLPGELRNRVYGFTIDKTNQALLRNLPRRATLRSRKPHRSPERRTTRPYSGFTQVCSQIRHEYRPVYMKDQGISVDLTQINNYLATFYHSPGPQSVVKDDGRVGNISIGIPSGVPKAERAENGIDLLPILDMCANSSHVQAGFGRYASKGHNRRSDGEARDMYRLFGRIYFPNGGYSEINPAWRSVLKNKELAAVRVYREMSLSQHPSIHILFKPEHMEAWMDHELLITPLSWLNTHGFADTEFFRVKVGVLR